MRANCKKNHRDAFFFLLNVPDTSDCVIFRPEAIALSVNVNAYLNLLNLRIELS